jgi:GT2 family glycosyltransferase
VRSIISSGQDECDILIIDDESKERHIEKLYAIFPNAHLRRARKRLEYCRAYNYAARFALKNGYVNLLILNSDSREYSYGFVDALEGGIDISKGIFAAGPSVKNFDGTYIHKKEKNKIGVKMPIPTEGYILNIEAFLRLGGFTKVLYRYVEDIDLIYRAKKSDFDASFVSSATFEHLGNGSSRIQCFVPYFYRLRNLIWFLKARKTVGFFDAIKIILYWSKSSVMRVWNYRGNGVMFIIFSIFSIIFGLVVGLLTQELKRE